MHLSSGNDRNETGGPQSPDARGLSLERRKKGKVVTVVRGLLASDNDLSSLLTHLKNYCGAGGTVDADELEIQGDQLEKVKRKLGEMGYPRAIKLSCETVQ